VDSAGGTIADVYDNLNRLTSETTAQGVISYTYDNASRRTSMTVPCASGAASCAPVGYSYDNAGRLTQISQSGTATSFNYDNANRRTSLTLPNNVVVSYSYDNDSHLTGITYQIGSNTLGNLTYAYDQSGRRTQVGGSFARTGLPGAVSAATYDAANELLNWNGLALAYDANGNMLTDGSNNFTWDARNHMAMVNKVNIDYDAFGRRTQNLAGTSFLYDEANAIEEFSGTTVTANLLSVDVDEIFSRASSTVFFFPLSDALGSTINLVDSNGNIQTSYTYDPFGNTSVTGISNANEFQYTGRENEGNGSYYYRARYYSPLLGRFVAEDPLKFGGGDINLYAYVGGSPTNRIDSLGESWLCPSFLPFCPNLQGSAPPVLGGRPSCGCPDLPPVPAGVNVSDNIKEAEASRSLLFAAPRLLWFYTKVRNHGPWDYKQIRTLNDFDSLSSPYEDLGNFNFGATGAAAGIELQVLLRGAGWAQERAGTSTDAWGHWYGSAPYGDDPDDQAQILAGFNYYKNNCYKQ
jgi:RHS repeat-associated protein